MLSADKRQIIEAEVSAPEMERRGRAFISIYGTLVLIASITFSTLIVVVRGDDILKSFDVPVTRGVQSVHLPLYDWILTHLSDLGTYPLNAVAYAAVFVLFFALQLRLEAMVGVASSLLAGVVGTLLKPAVHRPRPSGHLVHVAQHLYDYSFPSGHVIQYTTLFGFAFWVVWVAWRRSWPRTIVLVVLGLLVALVGPSRVYLGEHWPSDAIGAYCLASLWLAGTIEVVIALKPRLGPWWNSHAHRRRWSTF